MRSRSSMPHSQRGIAIVETVIALPLLLLLLLAVGELGRAMYQYNTLQKTARDAVRYLADAAICDDTGVIKINPDTCGVTAMTENLAVYGSPVAPESGDALLPGLETEDVDLDNTATHVTVTVTYEYLPLFAPIPSFGFGEQDIAVPTTFTVSATMRAL